LAKSTVKSLLLFKLIFVLSTSLLFSQTYKDSLKNTIRFFDIGIGPFDKSKTSFKTEWKNLDCFDLRILGYVYEIEREKINTGKFRILFKEPDSANIEILGYEKNIQYPDDPWITITPRNQVIDYFKNKTYTAFSSRRVFNASFDEVWKALSYTIIDFEIPVNYIDIDKGIIRSNFKEISDLSLNIITKNERIKNNRIKLIADIRKISTRRQRVDINIAFDGEGDSNYLLENIIFEYIDLYLHKINDPQATENFTKNGYYDKIIEIEDEELFNSIELINDIYQWVDYLNYRKSAKPFFDKNRYLTRINGNRKLKQTDLKEADRICKHILPVFDNYEIQFGKTIDFNYYLHILGNQISTDFIEPLLKAYIITKRKKYIKCFENIFNQWYEQKDEIISSTPELNNALYNNYAVMKRIEQLTEMYYYIENKYNLSYYTHENILKELLACGRWLYNEQISKKYSEKTAAVTGCWGLINLSISFPEFNQSGKWLKRSIYQSEKYLSNTNFFNKKTFSYDAYLITESFTKIYKYLVRYYPPVQEELYRNKLENMFNWLLAIKSPLSLLPAFNYPVYPDITTLFKKATEITNRSEFESVVLKKDTIIHNYKLPDYTSINLIKSKLAIMRQNWDEEALYMAINYGLTGNIPSVNFVIFGYETPMALIPNIDYNNKSQIMDYKFNNMVIIDNTKPVTEENNIKLNFWKSFENVDFFSADYFGFSEINIPITRTIVFIKSVKKHHSYWIIKDDMKCTDNKYHKYSWIYHSYKPLYKHKENMAFNSKEPGMVIVHLPKNPSYSINQVIGTDPLTNNKVHYDRLELSMLTQENNPSYEILLIPFKKNKIIPKFSKLNNFLKIKFDSYTDYFSLNPTKNKESVINGNYKTAFLTVSEEPEYISVFECTELTFENRQIIKSDKPVSIELDFRMEKLKMFGDDPTGITVYAPKIKEVYYKNTLVKFNKIEDGYIEILR